MRESLVDIVPETVALAERLVVAPTGGRFEPQPPEIFTTEGEWVEPGQVVAVISNGPRRAEVRTAFRGWMMGMLCRPGQPVKPGDALFWIRES